MRAQPVFEPAYFQQFKCIGADCEDTCCEGWGVPIDQDTYDKYQNPSPDAQKRLSGLVTINPATTSSSDFAKIQMDGVRCPAVEDSWCSIQQAFGESYLSDMCSTFPRVLNVVDGVLERSLNISCPEAARLVVTRPGSMTFATAEAEYGVHRVGSYSLLSTDPHSGLNESRKLFIELLEERSRPLWKRLIVLGHATQALAASLENAQGPDPEIPRNFIGALRHGDFDQLPASSLGDHAFQLEVVMELVVKRISSEYSAPRFLRCFSDFITGLGWTGESTMEEVVGQYRRVFARVWSPFLNRHEHVLENYVVNYVFKTLFPFGRKQPDQKLAIELEPNAIWNAYKMLVMHYSIIRTLLVGKAGLYGEVFCLDHAVKVMQSYAKAFQHSSSFPAMALRLLAEKGMPDLRATAILVAD